VALRILFAATNDLPRESELEALADRFVLKIETRSVKGTHFAELVDAGLRNEALRAKGQRPWARGSAGFEDFLKIKHFLDLTLGSARDRDHWFPAPVFAEMRRVVRALEVEDKVFISDRKLVKMCKLLRTAAFLDHGGAVTEYDLRLLAYLGNHRHELAPVREKVHALLGLGKVA
jgi:MoxR-like ATPase